MSASTRFTFALHILTLLASMRDEALTSDFIAASVNTNPVVVRRLLGLLRKRGFVSSRPGSKGGWRLARHPDSISLLDVRRAMQEGPPFAMHSRPPNPACPVGRRIQAALARVYSRAELAMEAELSRITVEGLLRAVRRKKQDDARGSNPSLNVLRENRRTEA